MTADGSSWVVHGATRGYTASVLDGLGATVSSHVRSAHPNRPGGRREIAVGNVVGSNLFNLLGVLGWTGRVGPGVLDVPPEVLALDLPILVATAILCAPIMATGRRIDRWEGAVLVLYSAGYVTDLELEATGHVAVHPFGRAMLRFVLPLGSMTLGGVAHREFAAD